MAKKANSHRKVTTSRNWIARGPLVPWMYKYICWLAEHPDAELSRVRTPETRNTRRRGPPAVERAVRASGFAARRITFASIILLEQRDDVNEYFARLRADAQFKARELAVQQLARNLEAREKGLEKALDSKNDGENMDVKAVEQYTRPFIDLAFPKKIQEEASKPRVTINIVGTGAEKLLGRVLSGEPDEVEFEVIETKQLEAGDDSL